MQWQTFVFISVQIIYLLTACSLAAVLWTDELVYVPILNNTNINQHNLPTTALRPHGSRVGEEVVAVCGNTRLHQFHLSYGYHQSSVSQSAAACVVPCSAAVSTPATSSWPRGHYHGHISYIIAHIPCFFLPARLLTSYKSFTFESVKNSSLPKVSLPPPPKNLIN